MLYITGLILFLKNRGYWKKDEKGHADRDSDYEKRTQKERQKLSCHVIRINPDKIDFNYYEEFGEVSTYIATSIKKQTEELTKKSLIDNLSKRL